MVVNPDDCVEKERPLWQVLGSNVQERTTYDVSLTNVSEFFDHCRCDDLSLIEGEPMWQCSPLIISGMYYSHCMFLISLMFERS